jgi:hypothetical protein
MTSQTVKVIGAVDGHQTSMDFFPCGKVARVMVSQRHEQDIKGLNIPIFNVFYDDLENYPENDGNIYIVSRVFIDTVKDFRLDVDHLVTPNDLIRDSNGDIIRCRSFAR